MKTLLIDKDGVVQNVVVPPAGDDSIWLSTMQSQYAQVLNVEDSVSVAPGWTSNGDGTYSAPVIIPTVDADSVMAEIYTTLSARMIPLAPYFGVAQALIEFNNWTGLSDYIAGLLSQNLILQSDSDAFTAIMLSNGVDLSKY